MEIAFEGKYTKQQILDSLKVYFRPSRRGIFLRVFCGLLTLGVFSYIQLSQNLELQHRISLIFIMLVFLYFIASPVFLPYQWVSDYQKRHGLENSIAGKITDEGVTLQTVDAKSEQKWSAFKQVKKATGVILLFHDEAEYTPLPRSFFVSENDWNMFVQLVEQKLPHS